MPHALSSVALSPALNIFSDGAAKEGSMLKGIFNANA
jgi:hypothetical protein